MADNTPESKRALTTHGSTPLIGEALGLQSVSGFGSSHWRSDLNHRPTQLYVFERGPPDCVVDLAFHAIAYHPSAGKKAEERDCVSQRCACIRRACRNSTSLALRSAMLLFDNGVRELRLLSFFTSFGGAKVHLWLGQCLPTKRPTWDGLPDEEMRRQKR